MNILPYYDLENKKLIDGEVFENNTFCKKNIKNKCLNFYKNINKPGLYTCPYGFTCISTKRSIAENFVYTSLVVKEKNNNQKKLLGKSSLTRSFTRDEILRLIGMFEISYNINQKENKEIKDEESIVHGIFHEIRTLSREIDSHAVYLQQFSSRDNEIISKLLDTIERTIKLMSIRIDSYELMKNPSNITRAKQPDLPVYKKFDKSRYILNSRAKEKNCYIKFTNESYFTIDGYEIFDLLPFILLDNAVKYSKRSTTIEVIFDDDNKKICIENIGPIILSNEKNRLCESGFRGKNAGDVNGSGIGLNMFKQIAEIHNIKYRIDCNISKTEMFKGKEYSKFSVELDFE